MTAPAWTCSVCGERVDERPVTWSVESGPEGERWLCADCTRRNLRSIEARLPDAWW